MATSYWGALLMGDSGTLSNHLGIGSHSGETLSKVML